MNKKLIALFLLLSLSVPSHAGVNNGQPVNASVTNAAFLDKNQDTATAFNIALQSAATQDGSMVARTQRFLNAVSSFVGVSLSAVYNVLPTWATSNRGTSSDTLFARSEALDTAFDPSTGHAHTGAAGDGPILSLSIMSGTVGTSQIAANAVTSAKIASGAVGTTQLATNGVTNSILAQMAAHTIKGNNTGSTANAIDLTDTQATAELNPFVGDSGSGGTKGMVPAPAAGDTAAGKFLKADGTFQVPPGSALVSKFAFFTSSTSWPKDASITNSTVVKITVIGGAGAGCTGNLGGTNPGGGGGGGGGKAVKWATGAAISATTTVTVGGSVSACNSGSGSSFGTLAVAAGGGNGAAASGGNVGEGGTGGCGTAGDVLSCGGDGDGGQEGTAGVTQGAGGRGGSSPGWGGGARGGTAGSNTNGKPGGNYGGGGGGGSGSGAGGVSAGGMALLEWEG